MFWKKYKYFISYWYELNNTESRIGDGFIEINRKINDNNDFSKIRKTLMQEIQFKTGGKCNCIGIINVKRIK